MTIGLERNLDKIINCITEENIGEASLYALGKLIQYCGIVGNRFWYKTYEWL